MVPFLMWAALGKNKVKLATVIEGDQKAPFSIATTPRCKGGRYSFLLIHTLFCWVLSKEVSSTIFKVFCITQPVIETRSPGQLVNILTTQNLNCISFLKIQKSINDGIISGKSSVEFIKEVMTSYYWHSAHLFQWVFYWSKHPLKLLFWYDTVQSCNIICI